MGFGQLAAATQFFLFGRRHCTLTGYKKHVAKYKNPDFLTSIPKDGLKGKQYLVTGANSGVGFEIASFLASRSATVWMVCRNAERAEAARKKILEKSGEAEASPELRLLLCDCGVEADVRRMWAEFLASSPERLDGLCCNAGALLHKRTLTPEGVEVTIGSHLIFGTYLLGTLARPLLEANPCGEGRVVVVSSGGMYNTAWPGWDRAASLPDALAKTKYDGTLAYAYAKRGQVLLCERWAAMAESRPGHVKYVTAHPGWAMSPGVEAAFGDQKRYLEPLRSAWEGAEGIVWALLCPSEELEGGAFYLDREPQRKHIAGPFFTEGSFTQNSSEEVDDLMAHLDRWSSSETRPPLPKGGSKEEEEALAKAQARLKPLEATTAFELDLSRFAGTWYVVGAVSSPLERGSTDQIEHYDYDPKSDTISVTFTYRPKGQLPGAAPSQFIARAVPRNAPHNTNWGFRPKLGLGLFLPVSLSYLVLHCDEAYELCMVGVPNRGLLYIMARTTEVDAAKYAEAIELAAELGYDPEKVDRVAHTA